MKKRVLVVDDSPFIRRVLLDWIKTESDFEIVGTAANGNEAIRLAAELKPDLITMDVEMPHCDGLTALQHIMEASPTRVLMVSSITTQGATSTMKALELGAIDFVTKPQSSSSIHFLGVRDELIGKLRACSEARVRPSAFRTCPAVKFRGGRTDQVVVIASSTGGPRALSALWTSLPHNFPAAILVVQHMPVGFTASLAQRLNAIGNVPVREAKSGDRVEAGQALICPGGQHMFVRQGGLIELNEDPPIHGVRPAADHLFNSAIEVYRRRLLGVVLTGMGHDGTAGACALRKAGSHVYGESAETCTIYGMPRAAKEAGGITAEFPIHEMAMAITAGLKERLENAS